MAKPVTQNCASTYNDFRANNHDKCYNYKGDIECQNNIKVLPLWLHACKDKKLNTFFTGPCFREKKNHPIHTV